MAHSMSAPREGRRIRVAEGRLRRPPAEPTNRHDRKGADVIMTHPPQTCRTHEREA